MVREYDDPTDLGLLSEGDARILQFRRRGRTQRDPGEPGTLGPITPETSQPADHRRHMDAIYAQMGWTRDDRPAWEQRMDRARRARTAR